MASTQFGSATSIAFSLFLILSFVFSASASSPSKASPSAETELICHTNNPSECYPKVFSATDQFQVVHEDQELPPGLHVQLDIQTGQKQAKLYTPNQDHPELAGLPVEQDIIVVDAEPAQEIDTPKIPAGAPAYEPVGVVKQPKEKNGEFSEALGTIGSFAWRDDNEADLNLKILEDLSHDMYYGLQIAEDVDALQSLFCLLFYGTKVEPEANDGPPVSVHSGSYASTILSSVVQNNAPALNAIEKSWDTIMQKTCMPSPKTIEAELFRRLTPQSTTGSPDEVEEARSIRLLLSPIAGLIKSDTIKTKFLENGGMNSFLRILLRDGEVWAARQAKVAQIVADTFLDEDFGAALGVWPKAEQGDSRVCVHRDGTMIIGDECWKYHLERISKDEQKSDWCQRLLQLLRNSPSTEASPSHHNEL
ncbi:hypothetical protein GGR57DRAFT_457331 [Xylariaceae sp. FL1272]|nr:hypothetical protein GGR57DRAFT_457331 [Xylariaceae sp. FL1272]